MMELAFYTCSGIVLISAWCVVTQTHAVHALLYLIVMLLANAGLFVLYGASFAAALQVIVYAGAIMVLFVFVMMMLNVGRQTVIQEESWLSPGIWIGPSFLVIIMLAEMLFILSHRLPDNPGNVHTVSSKDVGVMLFSHYALVVELASFLLLAALVAVFHLGHNPHQECPSKRLRPTTPENHPNQEIT